MKGKKTKTKVDDEGVMEENDEYWTMLKAHSKDENDLLRKISRSVVEHYGISADVY